MRLLIIHQKPQAEVTLRCLWLLNMEATEPVEPTEAQWQPSPPRPRAGLGFWLKPPQIILTCLFFLPDPAFPARPHTPRSLSELLAKWAFCGTVLRRRSSSRVCST